MAGVIVSDHAIVRYLQRVEGLDIERVKGMIVNRVLETQIGVLGSGRFPVNGPRKKYRAVVRNGVIATVHY